jgi:hypothetical protein
MRGQSAVAAPLEETADLFAGYAARDPPTTWEGVRQHYDPSERLGELVRRIAALILSAPVCAPL